MVKKLYVVLIFFIMSFYTAGEIFAITFVDASGIFETTPVESFLHFARYVNSDDDPFKFGYPASGVRWYSIPGLSSMTFPGTNQPSQWWYEVVGSTYPGFLGWHNAAPNITVGVGFGQTAQILSADGSRLVQFVLSGKSDRVYVIDFPRIYTGTFTNANNVDFQTRGFGVVSSFSSVQLDNWYDTSHDVCPICGEEDGEHDENCPNNEGDGGGGDDDGGGSETCECDACCVCKCTCGKWFDDPNAVGCSSVCSHVCWACSNGQAHGPGESTCCDCHCTHGSGGGDDGDDDIEWEPLPRAPEFRPLPQVPNPPPVPPVAEFDQPAYSFPEGGVVVPQRIRDGFTDLREGFSQKLGLGTFGEMMRPVPGQMDMLCISNPIRNFSGIALPEWKACLDFNELAQQDWVSPLRTMLLFVCVCMFFSSVITVLRQY